MSMIPFSHPFFDDFDRRSRLFDEALGYPQQRGDKAQFSPDPPSLYRGFFVTPTSTNRRPSAGRQFQQRRPSHYEDTVDRFRVLLDVQHFSPEEVNVTLVGNRLVVHAKHEDKQDEHGYISREFKRQYVLPDGTDLENVRSYMSLDGILTLEAPKLPSEKASERVIPIQMGDPPKEIEEGQYEDEEDVFDRAQEEQATVEEK